MLGGNRVQIGEKEFDFNDQFQNAIPNKPPNLKDLKDVDKLTFDIILETPIYKQYTHSAGTGKSTMY